MTSLPPPAVAHPLVQTRSLTLGYHGRPVVRDVTLTVRVGEYWVLLGPNGRGKTSLVNALLGTLRPLAGELRLEDAAGRRPAVGFVPQSHTLHGTVPTTVREFVGLGMVGLPLDRAAQAARLAAALAQVGLAERPRTSLWTLSGGQRQRALIARALVRHPALLVLDEPTTGLDMATEQALLQLVARLRREQALTVLLVTHDLALARTEASHAALFVAGTVRAGPRAVMLTTALLAETFGTADAEPAPGAGP